MVLEAVYRARISIDLLATANTNLTVTLEPNQHHITQEV